MAFVHYLTLPSCLIWVAIIFSSIGATSTFFWLNSFSNLCHLYFTHLTQHFHLCYSCKLVIWTIIIEILQLVIQIVQFSPINKCRNFNPKFELETYYTRWCCIVLATFHNTVKCFKFYHWIQYSLSPNWKNRGFSLLMLFGLQSVSPNR